MPFVQRNFIGEITGLFAFKQPGYAEEELSDDNPEIVAFIASSPQSKFEPLTPEQHQKSEIQRLKNEVETKKLQVLIVQFLQQWAELETTFSTLFYIVMNVEPKDSKLAYAVYYAIGSFDQRITIVRQSTAQLLAETPALIIAQEEIESILSKAKNIKRMRNTIAHGNIINLQIGSHSGVRLTAPSFDVNNIWRKAKGGLPGLTSHGIQGGIKTVRRLCLAIDGLNRLIDQYRQFGAATLPQTHSALKALIQTL